MTTPQPNQKWKALRGGSVVVVVSIQDEQVQYSRLVGKRWMRLERFLKAYARACIGCKGEGVVYKGKPQETLCRVCEGSGFVEKRQKKAPKRGRS